MKEIAFFADACYSRKNTMREYVRIGLFFSLFVICAAGFVVATTLGVLHYNNTKGQGGADFPGLPVGLSAELITTDTPEELSLPEETVFTAEEDKPLWYFSYCIQKGDMIGVLARNFGVSEDTIISVNNIKSTRLIQPGDYLKIPSMPGILYTTKDDNETIESITKKFDVDVSKCALANNMDQTASLNSGATVFIPDAKLDANTRAEINGDLFSKPIKSWYYISSSYGYRTNPFDSSKRTFHGGIDMACSFGTSIYAALSGRVVTAGWSDSYGNYVIIQHHSGYKTLYGHMSKILVTAGQNVVTGEKIGKVGSTGKSTGPHLHFGVYKNGRGVNPNTVLGSK